MNKLNHNKCIHLTYTIFLQIFFQVCGSSSGQVHCPCPILGCNVRVSSTFNSHRVICNGRRFEVSCKSNLDGTVSSFGTPQTISHPLGQYKKYSLYSDSVWKCAPKTDPPPPKPVRVGCSD